MAFLCTEFPTLMNHFSFFVWNEEERESIVFKCYVFSVWYLNSFTNFSLQCYYIIKIIVYDV